MGYFSKRKPGWFAVSKQRRLEKQINEVRESLGLPPTESVPPPPPGPLDIPAVQRWAKSQRRRQRRRKLITGTAHFCFVGFPKWLVNHTIPATLIAIVLGGLLARWLYVKYGCNLFDPSTWKNP